MKKKVCIFDLDGTLLDTVNTIAYYCNYTLRHFGFPENPPEKYKYFAGEGALNLLHRALGAHNLDNKENFEKKNFLYDNLKAKPMLSFSGWDLYGNSSALVTSQGISFLLNIFGGVAINAAIGIANQFNSGINAFSNNFLLAVRPQIVKRYANREYMSLMELVYNSAKYSYFLLLLIAVPFFFEVDFILKIWLVRVPEYLNVFCKIFIIKSLFAVCCSSVLTMLVHAIGRMKEFSFYRGTIILLTLPVSYLVLRFYAIPSLPIIINAIMDIIASLYTILLVKQLFNEFSIALYVKKVILPCFIVTLISLGSVYVINQIISQSLLRLILGFVFNFSIIAFILYFFILDINNKKLLKKKVNHFWGFINRR